MTSLTTVILVISIIAVTSIDIVISIEVEPDKLVYNVNDSIKLDCTVWLGHNSFGSSKLDITFEWKLHQSTVNSAVYHSPPLYNIYTNFHHLNNISLTDAGKYSCSVYVNDIDNGIQTDIKTEYKDITIRAPKPSVSILITEDYYNTGDNGVSIKCCFNKTMYTNTSCTIEKDGTEIFNNTSDLESISYVIDNVSLDDNGLYSCNCHYTSAPFIHPSNTTNADGKLLTVLDVNVSITSNRSMVLFEKNYNVAVDCAVDYQPKHLLEANNYIITVYDNDNNTVREIVSTINESIIVVEFDSPGFKHIECSISLNIVNTNISTSNYSDNITVYVKDSSFPLSASNINATILNATSVNVSWTISYIPYTPESYTVYYNSTEDNNMTTYTVYTSETLEELLSLNNTSYSIVLRELSPFTMYQFIIVSSNSIGSNTSSPGFFTTEEDEDTVAISTDDFLLTLSEIIPLSVGLAIATCFIIISFITMICCCCCCYCRKRKPEVAEKINMEEINNKDSRYAIGNHAV